MHVYLNLKKVNKNKCIKCIETVTCSKIKFTLEFGANTREQMFCLLLKKNLFSFISFKFASI